jgi:hypothetical protein
MAFLAGLGGLIAGNVIEGAISSIFGMLADDYKRRASEDSIRLQGEEQRLTNAQTQAAESQRLQAELLARAAIANAGNEATLGATKISAGAKMATELPRIPLMAGDLTNNAIANFLKGLRR